MVAQGRQRIRAAVLNETGGPFALRDLAIDPPRSDEVLVEIRATGVCHTDALVRSQGRGMTLPAVLGHEGAGIVRSVGASVRKVSVGDHVVLTFASCGTCMRCQSGHPSGCASGVELNFLGSRPDGTHALHGDEVVHDRFFGQSSFATHAIATERNIVKVPQDVPLQFLGALGCGIQTGAGAVLNVLNVAAGDSLIIFGSGAVGMSALMAAKVAGATTIIAVDLIPSRLKLAQELGATHVLDGRDDILAAIKTICPGGMDYALDTTGVPRVIRTAVLALRTRGVCGVLATADDEVDLSVNLRDFYVRAKSIVGIAEGDSLPDLFIPKLIELFRQGRFPIDRLMTFYPFDQINKAFDDAENGSVIKPVLQMA